MPYAEATRGNKVPCDCGMPEEDEPHWVSTRTRSRHRQIMGLVGATNDGDIDDGHDPNRFENENNHEREEGDMDIDVMGDDAFGQGTLCECMLCNCALIVDGILHKGLDHEYNDREMGYRSESERSETPSSTGSWMNIPTPPPSPPSTPPPGSDDEEQPSEDEDGFTHVTAEDYREYERWYAEDDMLELDEMSKLFI